MPWDPNRYNQFKQERSAPFEDLFGLIRVRPGLRVVDLGCGTGELTRQLAERLPESKVLGIDSSPEMLARAAEQVGPRLHFEAGRIEALAGQWDLVFSNAAIQWIEDHERLIPRLLSLVRPGGQLVVQLPSNHNHLAHRLILELAAEEPFRSALGGWVRRAPVLSIDQYAELLYAHGGRELVVFEKVYPHILANADAVADWTSGTVLVPYFERLGEALSAAFLERYRERLRGHWPEGPVFFGFRRTLFSAAQVGIG